MSAGQFSFARASQPRTAVRPGIERLQASLIGEVAELGFGDPEVIPLWFGEGDRSTPRFICEAAAHALAEGHTFYTDNRGIRPLRETLAAYETRLHERPVTEDRILVTSSGMQGIMLIVQSIVDPGDNILVVSPVWPNIRAAVEIYGGEPREVALGRTNDGGFRLDFGALEAARDARTRAVFVNSPSNPTGWVMTRAETEALLSFTRRHGIWLIADEVYARIVYDRDVAPSVIDVAEPEDRVIVVNSFSKAWAMTGWRLGWMVIPPDLPQMLAKLVQYNTSGSPTFLQHAAIAAIGEGESFIAEMRRQYRAARDRVVEHFERVGRVRLSAPEGAFYAFFQVEGMTDSVGFAKELLRRTKVGLAPGAAFGLGGEGHLRLCFAASPDRLDPALDRLAEALA